MGCVSNSSIAERVGRPLAEGFGRLTCWYARAMGSEGGRAHLDPATIREAVFAWWAARRRRIPVRERRDPYAVLVAEVMAQQTQIERVAEAWRGFLATFPSIDALAAARPADVLRAWGNLGYNRRAIALLRAAQRIVGEHGGVVPSDPVALERLPGVGPYTARAVAAIAHRRGVGPVDTNVARVLARLLDPRGQSPRRRIQVVADALADGAPDPGAWSYALMDLGATVCRPEPACRECPLEALCAFAAERGAGSADGDGRPEGGPDQPLRDAPGAGPAAEATARRRRRQRDRPTRLSPTPFPATRRWLRGRILERLRAEVGEGWVRIEAPIGLHGAEAVAAALTALAAEALLERHPLDPGLVRLPLGDGADGALPSCRRAGEGVG